MSSSYHTPTTARNNNNFINIKREGNKCMLYYFHDIYLSPLLTRSHRFLLWKVFVWRRRHALQEICVYTKQFVRLALILVVKNRIEMELVSKLTLFSMVLLIQFVVISIQQLCHGVIFVSKCTWIFFVYPAWQTSDLQLISRHKIHEKQKYYNSNCIIDINENLKCTCHTTEYFFFCVFVVFG